MENWKDINGYEGKYQVSDTGKIKSLSRLVKSNTGNRFVKERILKLGLTKNGYVVVNLGIRNTKNVHNLVLNAFNPINNIMDVMHIDNNRANNKLSNLKWGTRTDNLQQMSKEGRWKNQFSNGFYYDK